MSKDRITYCEFHPTIRATDNLMEDKVFTKPLWVCDACFNRFHFAQVPVCKKCGVKVKSAEDLTPISGHRFQQHKKKCPRAEEWNVSESAEPHNFNPFLNGFS